MICCKMRKLSYVVASVLVLAICGIVSATDDTSLLNDPTNDLIYIYTGVPVPPENYVGYVDVVMAEANKTEGSLDFFVTTNSGIPPMENATFWTVLMDGDNDPADNCPDYPTADVDTMYSIIYNSVTEDWQLERSTWETWFWNVQSTSATWGMTSTWPDGETIIHLSIPLTELDEIGDVLPWKVMTETEYIGDLAPDMGRVYLGDPLPEPWIYHPDNGSWIPNVTGIGALEVNNAGDIVSTLFEYSSDGATWYNVSIDYDGRANTWPHEVYNASWDGWSAVWNTSGVAEEWYYIRATMTDNRNQTGQSQITVYVDPTPPSPTIVQPAFDQVVNGTFRINATTEDEDINSMIFSVFRMDTSWYAGVEKNVPHTPQGYGCAPAAAAASLLWLNNYTNASGVKIFDTLVPPELEEPENLTEKMHKMFKTKDNILTGQHLTNDTDVVAGLKKYVQERKNAGMKEDFVVKAFGREETAKKKEAGPFKMLPKNTDWIKFYKTMLPHEDILLLLGGKGKNGTDWGHVVTANSFRPIFEIWWTPEGCIWAQVPPHKIDFMDHNEDTGYREVEMDENGNITGLEKYYEVLSEENQTIRGMVVFSPKTAYEDLWKALIENLSTPFDWMPIGKGVPSLGFQEFVFDWNTTSVEDGIYLLMTTAIDEVGNEASDIIWITVDNSAPQTTKTIGVPEYEDGYYLTSDTAVELSADDGNGIGLDSLYYRIWNNGTWSDWTWVYCGPVIVEGMANSSDSEAKGCVVNFTLLGNCTHYIEYYAVDIVGNNETIQNQTHVVDNEAPVTIKEVGEPSYYVNTTALGEHWIVTNETYLLLNGADDCCKIVSILLKNNNTEKTYHVNFTYEGGHAKNYIGPNKAVKFLLSTKKKISVTISERKGGKNHPIFKEDLNCSVLKFLADWGRYEKVGNRYKYNKSIGPSPFGITDLLLEEFCLVECKGSELKCWSGTNATMYREWYNREWTEWGGYTEPFTFEGGGIHYLEYYSVDNLDNTEEVNNETFFVTDALLEPFFVTPANNSLVYNNVTLWAGEATGRNVSYATFWYSADSENWTYIGIDDDGREPTVGGELVNVSDWGDGWSVYWNTTDIEEGQYCIKVDMYGLEGIGTTQACVYVDPTPPVPQITEPLDEAIVNGTVQLSVNSTDENVSWILWEYSNKTEYYEKGVEEKIQFNYCRNISGKNLSSVCCGPTAAASCLTYWAAHGYPNITRNGTINQSELVERLARLMKTDEKGTKHSNFKKGIEDYLNESGYGCDNPHGLKVDIETDANKLNFTRYRNELEANRENVLWSYKWNHNTSSCKWRNGHWVVGKSVNNSRSGNVSHEVDIMCPTYGNVSNVTMYDNGTIYRPDVRGWRHPSAMVTVSEKGSFEEPDWVEIANVTDPEDEWAASWDTTEVSNGYYFIRVTIVDQTENEDRDIIVVRMENAPPVLFDTGEGTYPSIMGIHNGTVKPAHGLNISWMYTYPCAGTGGHTEHVRIWNSTGWNVTATWNGYESDWSNISFNKTFTLYENETYNYTIITGSYPQIIHKTSFNATGGIITCTEFIDANGKRYNNWIPAIRLG
jgi:hypothetical protein